MDALKDYEQYVDDAVAHFTKKMQYRIGQTINMGLFVQLFAFDVIGEAIISKGFGFMDAGSDNGFFAQIESMMRRGRLLRISGYMTTYFLSLVITWLSQPVMAGCVTLHHRKMRVGKRLVAIIKTC